MDMRLSVASVVSVLMVNAFNIHNLKLNHTWCRRRKQTNGCLKKKLIWNLKWCDRKSAVSQIKYRWHFIGTTMTALKFLVLARAWWAKCSRHWDDNTAAGARTKVLRLRIHSKTRLANWPTAVPPITHHTKWYEEPFHEETCWGGIAAHNPHLSTSNFEAKSNSYNNNLIKQKTTRHDNTQTI